MNVVVKTDIKPDAEQITQVVEFLFPGDESAVQRLVDEVICLRDKHVREGLIKLGWTPPTGGSVCEWKKKGPADYGMVEYVMSCGAVYIGQEGHCNAFLFCPRCGKPRKETT